MKAGGLLTVEDAKACDDLTKLKGIGDATASDIAEAIALYESETEGE